MKENDLSKYSNVKLRYLIWLENDIGERILDDKTWRLLQAIQRSGSLRKAAAEMEISYRKAWGDLKQTEQLLGFPLIETQRGGAQGGESRLSAEGLAFVEAYHQFHQEFDRDVQDAIVRFKRKLKGKQPE